MTTTQIVILSAVLILSAYDIFAVIKGGVQNTISWQIVEWSKKWIIIPFAVGFLMGHLFGNMS